MLPDPDRRADLRQAVNTLMLMSVQAEIDEWQREQIVSSLTNYMGEDEDEAEMSTPDEAAAMFRQMFAGRTRENQP